MKVTYNWLRDFVELKLPVQELAQKLTMSGLEVVSWEEKEGDYVLEIEITPNRPDCLSVVGIAREIAALTGCKNTPPAKEYKIKSNAKGAALAIKIEERKDCPLYTAKIMRNVKVGPSPEWLKKRLQLLGCRSVNNIVDITNYVMFTWGEPLHAFDLDKLNADTIIIRRSREKEEIVVIDGDKKVLGRDILVIADTHRPIALAGIMGGLDTQVDAGTKNILLEAAVFNPVLVRRGRQKLGLQTESSYRFERGIDGHTAIDASCQAVRLIQEIAAGELTLAKSAGARESRKKVISLSVPEVRGILGAEITLSRVKGILNSLGFQVKSKNKENLAVTPPPYRQDISTGADLVEEVARIFGYENIPTTLPVVIPQISSPGVRETIAYLKTILTGLGSREVITYGLVDKNLLKEEAPLTAQLIEILNPLNKEQEVLRPNLLASLARCIAYNLNQKQETVNIFEIAKVFSPGQKSFPNETWSLGLGLCGLRSVLWHQGRIKEQFGLMHLKGMLEAISRRLNIPGINFRISSDNKKASVYLGHERIGEMLQLGQPGLEALGIKNKDVFIAEIDLDKFLACAGREKRFQDMPKYPAITRDISLVIKEMVKAEEILDSIRSNAGNLLREATVVDYYQGQQIPAGHKGLTVSCLYRLEERTLTEEEVNPWHAKACAGLVEKFGAQIR